MLVENYSNSCQVWPSRSFLQFLRGLRPNEPALCSRFYTIDIDGFTSGSETCFKLSHRFASVVMQRRTSQSFNEYTTLALATHVSSHGPLLWLGCCVARRLAPKELRNCCSFAIVLSLPHRDFDCATVHPQPQSPALCF